MGIPRLRADFNGLFQNWTILCLSHGDTCPDENGNEIPLHGGMVVTAFDEDCVNGVRNDLVATGTVEASPEWLQLECGMNRSSGKAKQRPD